MSINFDTIVKDPTIKAYIKKADESLISLGYTEHSFAHVYKVASNVEMILRGLGYSEHEIDLGKIAAYLHDIGNVINRIEHSQSGAVMAFRILDKLEMPAEDIATVITAIGNHDEGTGVPVNPIAAALIIADKSDVRRTRVRNSQITTFDIHDRVNYSVVSSELKIDPIERNIILELKIDTEISPVMEYFEIFLERMLLCRKASETLGMKFSLVINNQKLL
ncbi:MAG: HD domain-containing protein [Clostridia bacterium]|nr:HD domain-containing protein [Clostridia bacterium]MBR6602741.1 HD domain-containing protein [Clostridia bacterium]